MLTKNLFAEKAELCHERQEAVNELAHLQESMCNEVDMEPEEADDEIREHETAAILITMLQRKLQEIDSALDSIESGHYGICEHCGQPIARGRLIARPVARLCYACQQAAEELLSHH